MTDETRATTTPAKPDPEKPAPAKPVLVPMIALKPLGPVRQGTLVGVPSAHVSALETAGHARKASKADIGMAARSPITLTDEAIKPHLQKGTS